LLNIWNRDYSADSSTATAPEQFNYDQNQSDYDLRSYATPRYTRPGGGSLTPNIDRVLQNSAQATSPNALYKQSNAINCNPITPRNRHRNPPHNPPGCDPPDRNHGGGGHGGGHGGGGCQPVPEPATMALFGVAAGVAGLRKRFGRKA
jgi:hypothetical protein